ncbi:glycoside hydrolase family 125 protein [Streptomyces sp. NBC_01800]|uniref:glycoside hydrolase family 125 protein n=1 Tax=Streptomyces sp. NBC_01800 TaxID=2975945 RepID=UPI002DD95B1D|nr:glycoside hydrolase family 125 protein [Streptomyces sp. NBC_01800]WSA65616.1 glycoside hydrolase family 125 protein [Streptomyces sp. NBC_01800]WSA73501.1 glycoside hydrolase family 125 protein [Streptomyces sp. NBC_01800]
MSQERAVADGLTATALPKPLDLGNGLVAASFGADGSWLSIGAPHPVHGFVEMSGAPRFDESWRGDPAAARRYRGWLTEDRYAFLRLELPDEEVSGCRAGVDEEGRPVWRRTGRGWSCSVTAWAPPDRQAIVQRYVIEAAPGVRAALRFSGRLDRCALAEITEVNPPQPLEVHPEVDLHGSELAVHAKELATHALVAVDAPAGRWVTDPDGGTEWETEAGAGASGPVEITVTVSLEPPAWPGGPHRGATVTAPRIAQDDQVGGLDRIATGALRYILGCTALDVGGGDRTILTDHRLLPLSWTRDAYYQALLLLCAAPDDVAVTDVVQAHLRWLWGRGRAPGTPWMRSHLPDGRPKDLAIQADQQLYPMLELADYRRVTGRWPVPPGDGGTEPAVRWGELIAEVWRDLPRQGEDGLLAGAENPADDPSELPFALSTQILYWHTAAQLAPWSTELGLDALHLARTAQDLRTAVPLAFTCEGPFGPQWAYETDGAGHHRLYHDANDLPTAFAPKWGFCSDVDDRWAATMRFAFSEHNSGYVSGLHGGLGSAHTPGTWTLGDAQELAVAETTGDKARAASVLDRIERVAGVDGLLPETYDADTGSWLARHWFAWPAAVFGILYFGITGG